MIIINNIQSEILENLARYKFLCTSQVKYITGKSMTYVRENLSLLIERGYIKAYQLDKRNSENMYYLSDKGKDVIISHEKAFAENIKLPVGTPLVVRDFQHRKNFLDIHIALYQYLSSKGIEILKFHAYYDKTGNNRTAHNLESKTKLALDKEGNEFFMPDGICITYDYEIDEKNIYLIEMYNGKDTIRVLQQLAKHSRAIAVGSPAKRFGIAKNPNILCVFEFESSKQAVMKRLLTNERFKPLADFFFFASLEDLKKDFIHAWHNVNEKFLVF